MLGKCNTHRIFCRQEGSGKQRIPTEWMADQGLGQLAKGQNLLSYKRQVVESHDHNLPKGDGTLKKRFWTNELKTMNWEE